MLNYHDLYEIVRKEKYSENLQLLPNNFISELSEYFHEKKEQSTQDDNLFADSVARNKKQFENSLALFKEVILRRKKKLLHLVFVAAETGIMKRDYENMLSFEKDMFEKLVKAVEEGDKDLNRLLKGEKAEDDYYKLIIFNEDIEQFVDMSGKMLGPFKSGELVNLDDKVSEILVASGKASYMD